MYCIFQIKVYFKNVSHHFYAPNYAFTSQMFRKFELLQHISVKKSMTTMRADAV